MALVKGICGIEEKWEHLRIRSKKLFSEKKQIKFYLVFYVFYSITRFYAVLPIFPYFSLYFPSFFWLYFFPSFT